MPARLPRESEQDSVRVVIAGGGTGGHLYPGIAVAREVRRRRPEARVTFVGTAAGIEARVLPREGFELDLIRSSGLKGESIASLLRGLSLLPASALDAWAVLSRRRPQIVIGVGGYSSGPVVMLAALRRIPTLLLEQNAMPGLTNRLLSRVVRAAALTFEASRPYFGTRGFVTGNPVRSEFLAPDDALDRPAQPESTHETVRVLIFGGSQGAHAINLAMVEAAPELARRRGRLEITHQTGDRDLDLVREGYRRAGMAARVEPFIHEMHRAMKRAAIVVCRAGATTIAELTAAGRAAILVPLPTATDDHQRKNAAVLSEAGAAEILEERELTGHALAQRLLALVDDPARRAVMGRTARRFARPDATRAIVDRALELAEGRA